ncbi:dimethyl sulfoxide reductase anchor subunit [Virgibacillus sp. NKC19-3]|uniref:dimethyl sulfoxide reductase anchor subunit family protein n=1 Tax=Virgibacillus saliphilus TaxID=2831674 RepID=UPI001C9B9310|nr:DmsC/YnfH family molybdoenzyme membrane anchor subunit [Virgibacillus sp. NKC19-3]MBY7142066.1 dimethyl sulfoxide reductase anchor subunit [Virgibacillus sp. NKC19-3]
MHEWPLLIFTITMQAAIGGIFMLWFFQLRNRNKETLNMFHLFKIPLIVIALLSLVGLGASFAHLGSPMNAMNTLRNIGSSWMSREILVTGLFIGLACVNAAWALYRKKISSWLLLVATLVGFVDVYCMAAIYSNSLIGPWNSIHTFLSFYGTTFILGAVLAVALLIPTLYKQKMELEAKQFLKIALITVLVGIGFHAIGIALFPATMVETSIIESTATAGVLSSYQGMIASRWVISVLGIALLGYLVLSSNKKYLVNLSFIALLIFVMSEGMSRYVFYVLGA